MSEHDGAYRYTLTLDRDPMMQDLISQSLGMTNRWLPSGSEISLAEERGPDAVFLDAALGVETGEAGALIPRLKNAWPLTPVILTTQSADAEELTEGMALGADDFVLKPIEASDLRRRYVVRKRALIRRAARETVVVGDLTIDTLQRSVSTSRGQKFLSPTEVRLLCELAKVPGTVIHRDHLKSRCWTAGEVSDNALNRKLYEIRRRIMPLSDRIAIRTIYGVGFVIEET